jgi:hypothetical protein
VLVKYVFLFKGGPLDGNAVHGDDEEPNPPSYNPGPKAFGATSGGMVGAYFVMENPDTPADATGTVSKFRTHTYKVTSRESGTDGKLIIHAGHLAAVQQ